MSIAIRFLATNAILDGATEISLVADYSLDPADPGTIIGRIPDGVNIGTINLVAALGRIQRPISEGGLGGQIVKKSAALQRGFGVSLDDYLVAGGVVRYTAAPGGLPNVSLADRGTALRPFTVQVSEGAVEDFIFGCDLGASEPALVLTGQSLLLNQIAMAPAQNLELTLYLVPIDDPEAYVEFCRAVGPQGPPGVFIQEAIAAEAVVGVDLVLAAGLSVQPFDVASVALYRDGVFLKQGVGFDYVLQGATNQDINWLAGTGTAPNLAAIDVLVAKYNA